MQYNKEDLIKDIRDIINKYKRVINNKAQLRLFKSDLETAVSDAFKREYQSMFDSEGTQVDNIAKKEGYPKFKKGKQIVTPDFTEGKVITEDETPITLINRLQQEEQDAIKSYENAENTQGISNDIKKLLDHIKKEEIEHYLELRNASKTI